MDVSGYICLQQYFAGVIFTVVMFASNSPVLRVPDLLVLIQQNTQ